MSERDESMYIEDMLEFCEKAMSYAEPLTEKTLTHDAMRYDAILRNIELIGEASTHVLPTTRALAPDLPVLRASLQALLAKLRGASPSTR